MGGITNAARSYRERLRLAATVEPNLAQRLRDIGVDPAETTVMEGLIHLQIASAAGGDSRSLNALIDRGVAIEQDRVSPADLEAVLHELVIAVKSEVSDPDEQQALARRVLELAEGIAR